MKLNLIFVLILLSMNALAQTSGDIERDFDFAMGEASANLEGGTYTKTKGGTSSTIGLLGYEFHVSALAIPKDMRYSVLLGTINLGMGFPVSKDEGVHTPVEKLKGLIEVGFNYRLFETKCSPVASAGLKLSAQLMGEIKEKNATLKIGAGLFCQFSKNVGLIIIYNPIQAAPSVSLEDQNYNKTKIDLSKGDHLGNTHGLMAEVKLSKYVNVSGRYDQYRSNENFYRSFWGRVAVRVPMLADEEDEVGAMNVFLDGGGVRVKTPGEIQGHYGQAGIGVRF